MTAVRWLLLLSLLSHCRPGAAPAKAPQDPTSSPKKRLSIAWQLDQTPFSPPNIPDALVFYGWSPDGNRFAYEVEVPGEGTACSGERRFRIIDAGTDRFVATETVEHPHKDRDDCDPKDLARAIAPARAKHLAENGIETAHFVPPLRPQPAGAGRYRVTWSDKQVSYFRFEERFVTDDIYSEEAARGAGYRLVLETPGSPDRVIEPGTRRRRRIIGYRLEPSYVFPAPKGSAFGVFLIRLEAAFEGARWSWMVNGARRPKSAANQGG